MRPASGLSSPEIRLRRVVFPAPFGPMTAWNSPGPTSIVTSSVTTRPPNFLRTFCKRNSGSAMSKFPAKLPARSDQSAMGEKDDQDEQGPEDHLPVLDKS